MFIYTRSSDIPVKQFFLHVRKWFVKLTASLCYVQHVASDTHRKKQESQMDTWSSNMWAPNALWTTPFHCRVSNLACLHHICSSLLDCIFIRQFCCVILHFIYRWTVILSSIVLIIWHFHSCENESSFQWLHIIYGSESWNIRKKENKATGSLNSGAGNEWYKLCGPQREWMNLLYRKK